ncbi:MAG: hypothetical protein U0T82_03215 [Bacteroidales bacterium]
MQTKLQELTEKIYREGLEKGNEEASMIISQAHAQAKDIIAKAKAEEQKILAEASRKAKEIRDNAESELRIAMRQALNSLKQQVAELINAKVMESSVRGLSSEPAFMKELILSIAKNWSAGSSGTVDLTVILPAGREKELQEYFLSGAEKTMKSGLELKFDTRLKSGFEISPANGFLQDQLHR